jgi:Ca-activated chloride channel family protein
MRVPAGLLLTALALGAGPARAQKPSPPEFPVAANTVHVTVTVRDEKGHLIPDLELRDFVLRDAEQPQEVTLFARTLETGADDALVLDLGLLLDTSESMLKDLKLSHQAAARFLEAVPRARELITVFFDEEIRLSRYDGENQQGLFERLQDARGGGWTALYDAIAVYLSRVQGTEGRKVMVVLTDGDDSRSRLSRSELLQLLRGSSVTVYAIAFPGAYPRGDNRGAAGRGFLVQITELTGGRVFEPLSGRDLPQIYETILDELRSQYVLGFVPAASPGRDKYHKLEIEVKRKGVTVRHRKGYIPE